MYRNVGALRYGGFAVDIFVRRWRLVMFRSLIAAGRSGVDLAQPSQTNWNDQRPLAIEVALTVMWMLFLARLLCEIFRHFRQYH